MDVADLEVLDLTDDQVRQRLGISIADLTSDDYSVTQTIAEAARHAGFGGILAPSAALQGRRTLVIFARGTTALAYGPSSVRMPPACGCDTLNDQSADMGRTGDLREWRYDTL